jgi:succinate-semialdehyde dehydrogenase/glutarate-semialdehyde dehydrogenase
LEEFSTRLRGLKVGDPLERSTAVGPLAMARTRERLVKQVDALVGAGATRLAGALPMSGKGYFFEPGVVTDVPRDTPCYGEEIFGPVALVFEADGLDQAIEVANDSPYGLGSAIWTRDPREMERAVAGIDAGSTFVNSLVKSDPRLPFGGVKQSGYGRELARDGILEFVNTKAVWMA